MIIKSGITKREKMQRWKEALSAIADDMEEEGYEANAEHLDFIMSDINFECAAFDGGAEVIFKDNNFFSR